MDPITLNKLLSIADAIETQREENQLPLDTFYEIVNSHGQIKHLERRVWDILRVFEAACWLTQSSQDSNDLNVLCLKEGFDRLILAWDSGDHLLLMNQELKNYTPYACFLDCLKKETKIEIPHRENKDLQRALGQALREKYGITFVAFDIFRTWAVSVGFAYFSSFDRSLYWGGEWDTEQPTLESFRTACIESYYQTDKSSGFANLGLVAHLVCIKLQISFQAFEIKMNQFVETFPGEVRLSPATIRRELSRRFKITTVRPRRHIIRERLAAKLQECEMRQTQWLEHQFLEDGIRVKGNLVKLIRWEARK